LFKFEEIEVRPACVLGIEVLLALAPSGVYSHFWHTLRYIIVKSDDGVKVLLCC